MTSKLALERLAEQGLVYRLPRRGTFLSGRHGGVPTAGEMPKEKEPDAPLEGRVKQSDCSHLASCIRLHFKDLNSYGDGSEEAR